MKRGSQWIIGLLTAVGALAAQDSKLDAVRLRPAPAGSGAEMFFNYCAPCHGRDATGRGPVSPSLKTRTTDLTRLTQNNGGTFPAARVKEAISGGARVPAHGTKDMPVWGPLFRYLGSGTEGEVSVRIESLTRYIESLQVPAR